MVFVNGHGLGRHWLIEANGYGADEFWHKPDVDGLSLGPAGEPTQRFYRIPREWLKRRNRVVIFEEDETASIEGLRIEMRRT